MRRCQRPITFAPRAFANPALKTTLEWLVDVERINADPVAAGSGTARASRLCHAMSAGRHPRGRPVTGSPRLLLANRHGRSGFDDVCDLVGLRVVLDGWVERRRDILVFLAVLHRTRLP